MISLAGGAPAPEVFPVEDIAAASERALLQHTVDALPVHRLTEGYLPLRQFLTGRMNGMGMNVTPEHFMITVGSAADPIDLVGRLFIDPGTLVAIEDPTYMSAVTAFAPQRPTYVTIPVDDDGLDVDKLEAILKGGAKPAFLYTIPAFQNPTGVSLSMDRRRRLLELADRYDLPIVKE